MAIWRAHPVGDLGARLAAPPGEGLSLYWLGQAGFVIDGGGRRVVIDPYLSDSLAEKYQGKPFPHLRMMPAPAEPGAIGHVDAVLVTHGHTDHLDPGTLPALLGANPGAVLIGPASIEKTALVRSGIEPARYIGLDAGGEVTPLPGLTVAATRAAHETLACDRQGRHLFLGLAIGIGGRRIFHSGDTIPFEGQEAEVAALGADLALFPVNGRDEVRRGNGVPGNMTADEALALARAAGIGTVIAHHFDMFDFNTVPRDVVESLAATSKDPNMFAARAGTEYRLEVE